MATRSRSVCTLTAMSAFALITIYRTSTRIRIPTAEAEGAGLPTSGSQKCNSGSKKNSRIFHGLRLSPRGSSPPLMGIAPRRAGRR